MPMDVMQKYDLTKPLSESNVSLKLADIQRRCSEIIEDTGRFVELTLEEPLPPAEGFNPYDRG